MIADADSPGASAEPEPKKTFGLTGCAQCQLLKPCGGHPLPFVRQVGCANFANKETPFDSDDMNPVFPERFWHLWNDVGGLFDYGIGTLRTFPAADLPRYLPILQNRQSFRRARLLDTSVIALRLFDLVVRRKDGSYGPKFTTASALRRAYKLRHDTRILLVGVHTDPAIEQFWAEHQRSGLGAALADLGVIGVTIPNFSFFTCVPRFQVMRNLKRLLLSAERLSTAGVAVAIHVNANTSADWAFWAQFLREHPECSIITLEFQTGSRLDAKFGEECFNQLVALQQAVGRPLHPILVGAARYYRAAAENFASFTVIDSQPFMQALNRQTLVQDAAGRWQWVASPTPKGAPIDDLIENNILHYEDRLIVTPPEEQIMESFDPNQAVWEEITSTPYLTAQPPASGMLAK